MSSLQGTVLYLLRKRHSNLKRSAGTEETKEAKRKSKKGKGPAGLEEASSKDIEKHQKQLTKYNKTACAVSLKLLLNRYSIP